MDFDCTTCGASLSSPSVTGRFLKKVTSLSEALTQERRRGRGAAEWWGQSRCWKTGAVERLLLQPWGAAIGFSNIPCYVDTNACESSVTGRPIVFIGMHLLLSLGGTLSLWQSLWDALSSYWINGHAWAWCFFFIFIIINVCYFMAVETNFASKSNHVSFPFMHLHQTTFWWTAIAIVSLLNITCSGSNRHHKYTAVSHWILQLTEMWRLGNQWQAVAWAEQRESGEEHVTDVGRGGELMIGLCDLLKCSSGCTQYGIKRNFTVFLTPSKGLIKLSSYLVIRGWHTLAGNW